MDVGLSKRNANATSWIVTSSKADANGRGKVTWKTCEDRQSMAPRGVYCSLTLLLMGKSLTEQECDVEGMES
jgi:hypothetical protein